MSTGSDELAKPLAAAGQVLVALATVALLTSLTGLAAASALLVPAHVWAARRHRLVGRLAWGLLAGAATAVAAAIGTYVVGIGQGGPVTGGVMAVGLAAGMALVLWASRTGPAETGRAE